jgi:hypothetical protein
MGTLVGYRFVFFLCGSCFSIDELELTAGHCAAPSPHGTVHGLGNEHGAAPHWGGLQPVQCCVLQRRCNLEMLIFCFACLLHLERGTVSVRDGVRRMQ